MGSEILKSILDEKIELFRFAFEHTSKDVFYDDKQKKFIHPVEYGRYREEICKDFLHLIIPTSLEIVMDF